MTRKGQKWRCCEQYCKAHIFTDALSENLIDSVGQHDHNPPANFSREALSNFYKVFNNLKTADIIKTNAFAVKYPIKSTCIEKFIV